MIVEEILQSVQKDLKERKVKEVRIGLGYTAVKLDDGSCGLAATLRHDIAGCCSLVERAGKLSGSEAYLLGELISSTDILESTMGLAVVNTVVNKGASGNTTSPIEALEIGRTDIVGMVGYFSPLIEPVQKRCEKLYVFERKPSEEEFVHPDWAADILIPECDIVMISGTAVINKTIDHLLELCQGRVAILGPSTPLSPIFKNYGVSFLFGSRVKDVNKVLKIVSEGGGTRSFGNTVEKVNLKL